MLFSFDKVSFKTCSFLKQLFFLTAEMADAEGATANSSERREEFVFVFLFTRKKFAFSLQFDAQGR
jgi:hypothetical protein